MSIKKPILSFTVCVVNMFITLTFLLDDDYILTMDKNIVYKEFGRRLSDARKTAELTQQALAEQVGLKRTSITNIEKGRQHIPLHMLFSLAAAVGVSPSTLLPEPKRIHEGGAIDIKLLSKQPLRQDQLDYVATLVTSGMIRKEGKEDTK
jgi:transcriptional regulator with XRE-family HTH domain